jgi:hypothetical protein
MKKTALIRRSARHRGRLSSPFLSTRPSPACAPRRYRRPRRSAAWWHRRSYMLCRSQRGRGHTVGALIATRAWTAHARYRRRWGSYRRRGVGGDRLHHVAVHRRPGPERARLPGRQACSVRHRVVCCGTLAALQMGTRTLFDRMPSLLAERCEARAPRRMLSAHSLPLVGGLFAAFLEDADRRHGLAR